MAAARDKETGLTPKQEHFAQLVAAGKSLSDAHRIAYPASLKWKSEPLHVAASALASDNRVTIRIQALRAALTSKILDHTAITQARILDEIARLALADPRSLFDEAGNLRPIRELTAEQAAMIASVDIETRSEGHGESRETWTVRKVRLWNKGDALEKAAKHLGLYREDNLQKNGLFDGMPREVVEAVRARLKEMRANEPSVAGKPGAGSPVRLTH